MQIFKWQHCRLTDVGAEYGIRWFCNALKWRDPTLSGRQWFLLSYHVNSMRSSQQRRAESWKLKLTNATAQRYTALDVVFVPRCTRKWMGCLKNVFTKLFHCFVIFVEQSCRCKLLSNSRWTVPNVLCQNFESNFLATIQQQNCNRRKKNGQTDDCSYCS